MFPDLSVVDLSRMQFGFTALFHFLFVPLTLGLVLILAIMETVFVMTGKEIWREMTKFWGILFGINFAMGVSTGLPMEFQFGTNWAYYAHYVGDIFGAPLAIEGLMAFFLEATFIGLFFFGWKRLSRVQHCIVTWLLAFGTNMSALWILIANGWMQHPVGTTFNVQTMRMEITDFFQVLFNPVAQAKFVHTLSAGYVTGSMFVLSISAYYLLRGRNLAFAKRSFAVAASFGLASALSVIVLGDESGYLANSNQHMKMAAMEAVWTTEKAPAPLVLFAVPDQKTQTNKFEVKIPYLLGLIGTRSLDTPVEGIKDLQKQAEVRVKRGIVAYAALQNLRKQPNNARLLKTFRQHEKDLGYGYLLTRYTHDLSKATPAQIKQAAKDTVPNVWPIFYAFRVMIACGFAILAIFFFAFYWTSKRTLLSKRRFLSLVFYSLPLPWIALEMGWLVAEYGRQPWVITDVLPTFMGVSHVPAQNVWISLGGFALFYSILFVVDVTLLRKYIRKGPDGLAQTYPDTFKTTD
ncbi:MAG: cytochrome bd oxidase subunit I [marine bacterium B5-7]|nr:MAG: cytochrome bd oxidase subunit I [marine bacterium B5-7]